MLPQRGHINYAISFPQGPNRGNARGPQGLAKGPACLAKGSMYAGEGVSTRAN